MKRAVSVVLVGLGCAVSLSLEAQEPTAEKKPRHIQPLLEVSAVAGCLGQEGAEWFLTAATGPLKTTPPRAADQTDATAGGRSAVATSTAVTPDFAKAQPVGKERYRLMGLMSELQVPTYKGHRVLARGFILQDAKGKRINLTSVESAAPACN